MSGLFKTPKPAVTPTLPMPDENDPAILEAKRRRMMETLGRSGRGSTILDDEDKDQRRGVDITYSRKTTGGQ